MKNIVLFSVIVLAVLIAGAAFAETVPVTLSDDGIVCDDPGLRVSGSVLTIIAPGEYRISGTLSQGQIEINCEREGKVTLELNNVSIHNETGPAIIVRKCKPRAYIDMMENSENTFSGGEDFVFEDDDEPNGVIYSKDDLTIKGSGVLNVVSKCLNGIVSKDDLRIKGGVINVNAPHDGIRGKDSLEIFEGVISITAGNDGLKSTNDDDPALGFVEISGGNLTIVCGDDPISAVTAIRITGGTFDSRIIVEE